MIRKKDITDLVTYERKNSLVNHLQIFLTFDFTKYYGEIRKNEILLWHSSYWLRVNYPVFALKFNNEQLVGLKLEKNPIQKIMEIGLILAVLITLIIIFLALNAKFAFKTSSVFLLFFAFFYMLFRHLLKTEKNGLINDFRKVLEEIEMGNNPSPGLNKPPETIQNEWNYKKVIQRIILYPICLGLIYISFKFLLPSEKPIHGIVGIGTGLSYLIADILILYKKLQRRSPDEKITDQ